MVRDPRMMTEARAIQVDVGRLLDYVRLRVERAGKLAAHFRQAEGDLAPLGAAGARIQYRYAHIVVTELDEAEPGEAPDLLRPVRRAAQQNWQPPSEASGTFPYARGGVASSRKAAP